MKKFSFIIILLIVSLKLFASHIVGGEVFYRYIGPGVTAGTSEYQVSLRLFRDCNVACGGSTNVACLPEEVLIGIFINQSPFGRSDDISLPLSSSKSINLSTYPPCISSRPSVCYEVKTYTNTVILNDNTEGYILSYQNCCRAASENVLGNANTVSNIPGATYTAIIPGTGILPAGHNSSAIFNLKDTSLVCFQSQFTIDFSAVDDDNDSLSYAFVSAYDGGAFTQSQNETPAGSPVYDPVSYNTSAGFSGISPLGLSVNINSSTGLISGVAPSRTGRYVVNVVVYEWRNGVKIAEHQKDFIMRVENCNIPAATLNPSYQTCDGFDLSFRNESTSPVINSYYWDFGVANTDADTSISPTPTYVFSDSGTYVVTLITNRGQQCSDTATTIAKVYPGFIPDFSFKGSCILNPYQFTDLTTSKYGVVDSWHWDFGEAAILSDTSVLKNPVYKYSSLQTTNVRLIVTNSKGCLDTISRPITVSDKPTVQLAFTDTLICIKDTLLLNAGSGTPGVLYSWSPNTDINNTSIATPLVYPSATTTYAVTINDKGCINTDSVKVNVIPFVTLNLGNDTTICLTDAVQMFPNTNALYFSWSPVTGISDTTIKNPFITPLANTTYTLDATVGNCSATDKINITVVPYPQVYAGIDTFICYGKTTILAAETTAPNYTWSPVAGLLRENTLSPTAGPLTSTNYIITVSDVLGCPKPVRDTVLVTVIPPVPAFAGHDTTIVINQPLQLNAAGGTVYAWSPATGMDNPNIATPVVTLGTQYDSVTYRVLVSTPEGCSASDDIKVIVFKSFPDIFVPSAFTPNGDGKNDIMRPKVVGMKQYKYFRIYNRLGQLVFSTSTEGQGWDGMFGGQLQAPGAYVYAAEAVDYTGKVVSRKGTLVLIR